MAAYEPCRRHAGTRRQTAYQNAQGGAQAVEGGRTRASMDLRETFRQGPVPSLARPKPFPDPGRKPGRPDPDSAVRVRQKDNPATRPFVAERDTGPPVEPARAAAPGSSLTPR